jgi:hypothetical protein
MASQETTQSPETTMKQVFCSIDKVKYSQIRPPTLSPTEEEIKAAYIKNILNAVKWSDVDIFCALLIPETVHYAYLYEYGEIPLIEYLFVQHQAAKATTRARALLKMALHLSSLIHQIDSNNFYDALGHTREEVETVCQES